MLPVELVQLVGPRGEQGALAHGLHPGAELEHVTGGSVAGILYVEHGQQILDRGRSSGLGRALVDRAGHDEVGAEEERGGDRFGGAELAGEAP